MRAVVCTSYGPPEILHIEDVEKPVPKGNEILIRVDATTVNRTDCGVRGAKPFVVRFFSGLLKPKRQILGSEFAGEIEAVGRDVTSFSVGDQVFGERAFALGTHADYLCMPEDGTVARKPENLTSIEAAAVFDSAIVANTYLKLVDFDRHRRILINGASGAIGLAGVQLAKLRGAEVTAVCKTEAVGIIKSLGADHVVDYKKEDFTKLDQTFDVVFDAVGKSSLARCKNLLREGGIFFATDLGPMWQNPFLALRTAVFGGKIKVYFPLPKHLKEEFLYIKELVEAGKYRPVIDRTYPFEQIVEAHKYVETEEKVGNVVIVIARD